jgi:hypothetical protein
MTTLWMTDADRCLRHVGERAGGWEVARSLATTVATLAPEGGGGQYDYPSPCQAAPGGPADAKCILIRVLHMGLFPQDRTCDLRQRRAAGDRYEPLGSDGVWPKRGPPTAPGKA